jgi:hypothetical protein
MNAREICAFMRLMRSCPFSCLLSLPFDMRVRREGVQERAKDSPHIVVSRVATLARGVVVPKYPTVGRNHENGVGRKGGEIGPMRKAFT